MVPLEAFLLIAAFAPHTPATRGQTLQLLTGCRAARRYVANLVWDYAKEVLQANAGRSPSRPQAAISNVTF